MAEADPEADIPYLVQTTHGPQIAEWYEGKWVQWLSGGFEGIGVSGEVISFIPVSRCALLGEQG